METKIISVLDAQQREAAVSEAAAVLQKGGLVVFPTETVYGLGGNAFDQKALAAIYEAKGRPKDNPFIVHIAEKADLARLVEKVTPCVQELTDCFWPGPLTIILPKRSCISSVISGGLSTVAVRMPSHPVAQEMIRKAGVPVAAPSANLSGSPSPTSVEHCISDMMGRVDMIVDGGPCEVGVESTVISFAHGLPRLLRPGAVTLEQLRAVLGRIEVDEAVEHRMRPGVAAASPGMKYKHYAPKAKVVLVNSSRDAFARYVNRHQDNGIAALVFDGEEASINLPCITYGAEHQPAQQAQRLFAALRQMDEQGFSTVYARCPSKEGIGLAVYNRLIRAAGFLVIDL